MHPKADLRKSHVGGKKLFNFSVISLISNIISLLQKQGEEDTTTMVDISVMVWYTPQFRNTFETEEDMNVFVDLIFAESNQGYKNSEIPVNYK